MKTECGDDQPIWWIQDRIFELRLHPSNLFVIAIGQAARQPKHLSRRIDRVYTIEVVDQSKRHLSGAASGVEQGFVAT